jgi:hypothetical protein
MSVRRALIPLALLVAACSDARQPTAATPTAQSPHFLRWANDVAPRFSAVGAISSSGGGDALHDGLDGLQASALVDGISLDRYTAAFWAVRGEERSVQINYLSATGDTSFPFLQLTITDPIFVPGQGDLAVGDSVLVTVTIDPTDIKVSFEPTGLLFGDQAQLKMSYGGAGGDLNGDGLVDAADADIETQLLGLWYREGAESSWSRIPASQVVSDKSFISALLHFSEYAVSW